ncbi:hypothetical protein FVER14953_21202 [Fusarium verticillioides]|nr:hypothetical protein FVER14953_21202 [Fusarium verticillioides]
MASLHEFQPAGTIRATVTESRITTTGLCLVRSTSAP